MWECGLKHYSAFPLLAYHKSLPMWECGLKRNCHNLTDEEVHVTPHVGVWIETLVSVPAVATTSSLPMWECGLKLIQSLTLSLLHMSLPMWECGLKHAILSNDVVCLGSLPMWECGLKPSKPMPLPAHTVTPHVGVWIETSEPVRLTRAAVVTPHVGVWIETQ